MNTETPDFDIEIDDEWITVAWDASPAEEAESLYGSYSLRFSYAGISIDDVGAILRQLDVPAARLNAILSRVAASPLR